MPFLKQPHILPFLCHKSATTCQIDPNRVANSKLNHDLSNCVKLEIIESTAPSHSNNANGAQMFWDTL